MSDDKPRILYLSPSTAATLLSRSPKRAWREHYAGGGEVVDTTDEMRRGKLLDRLLFGVGPDIVIVDAKDWRTDKAKAERAAAESDRKIAVLKRAHDDALAVADRLRAGLLDVGIDIAAGKCQHRLVWESGGVPCKAFLDCLVLGEGEATIYDLKIREDASPSALKLGLREQLQYAAYPEAVETLDPSAAGRVKMLFILAEPDGHDFTLAEPDGQHAALARSRWARAVALWGECLRTNTFPGYPKDVQRLAAKPWDITTEQDLAFATSVANQEVDF